MGASVQSALYGLLIADTAVAALVSTRVYHAGDVEQSPPRPYIVLQRISTVRAPHMLAAGGIADARVQVTCIADDHGDAHDVAEAVRDATDGLRGAMGTGVNALTVRRISLEGQTAGLVPPSSGQRSDAVTEIFDLAIWHNETVPVH